jgi:dTDP-4-dehydrorhamnose 3,5-epimerase
MQENGYRVIAFGRNAEKLAQLKGENIELFQGDFCNPEDITQACAAADYVIHCGALLKGWGRREDFIRTNVEGTRNVLRACEENHIKRLIYTSSPSVQPLKNDLHLTEKDYNENNHLNYYIESKILAEKMITADFGDIDWTILRPRGLFGIGDTSIVPRLIQANKKIGLPLFGGGKNFVDMTCVENVAYAIRLAAESKKSKHNIYNITNDEPQEFKGLLEELFAALGETPRYRNINLKVALAGASAIERIYKIFHIYKEPAITKYTICTLGYSQTLNIDRAKKDLGYKPKITLSQGIKKYAADRKKR